MEQKRQLEKLLLSIEVFVGILVSAIFISLIFVAAYIPMHTTLRIILIICGLIQFIIGVIYALKIEQVTGYYQCRKCKHEYIPTFSSVLWAAHIGRTRYMRCPECNQKSWQKKVLSAGDDLSE